MENKVGEKIASLRKEKNLSQKDLAEQLNVSNKTISKWECGGAMPDVESLHLLSRIFGVSMDDLLNGTSKDEQITPTQKIEQKKEKQIHVKEKIVFGSIALVCLLLTAFLLCYFFIPRTPNISSDFFNVDNSTLSLSCKVDNDKESLSLDKTINVPLTNDWKLYYDNGGIHEIPSKTVNLQIGDNTYFIVVKNSAGETKTFTVKIRRKPLYTVSFNSNGGEQVLSQIIQEDNLASYVEPIREGYIFNGWDFDFSTPITENITINAKWVPKELNITYFANNGTDSLENQKVVFGTNVHLNNNIFTKQGYTLESWNTKSNGLGDKYELGQFFASYNIPENLTLYAQWSINHYDIVVNKNIENAGTISGTGKFEYSSTNTITATTNKGYTWLGWYSKDNEFISKSQSMTVTLSDENVEYNAVWQANNYTITLDVVDGEDITETTYTVTFGERFEFPTTSKYEATFLGWFTNENVQVSNANGIVEAWNIADNTNLYAHFRMNQYLVVLNKNIENAGNVTGGGLKDYDSTIEIEAINNEGYSFVGWYNESSELTQKNLYEFRMPNHQLTYTAKWKANEYNITLNVNNGKELGNNQTKVTYGNTFSFSVPMRDGYSFCGWYLGDPSRGEQLTNSEGQSLSAWNIASDTEVIAKWDIINYTLEFELNGGTLAADNPSSYSIEDLDIQINNPTKTGYNFEGWVDKTNFIPQKELIIYAGSMGNKKYAACWKRDDKFIAISSSSDLKNISQDLNANYYLMTDIDMNGVNFSTIGDSEHPFTGILDGNGYTISNLTYDNYFIYQVDGEIRNLGFKNTNVKFHDGVDCSLFTHTIGGAIVNCKFDGTIIDSIYDKTPCTATGLAIVNNGLIKNCYVSMNANIYVLERPTAMGMVYQNAGTIEMCYCNVTMELRGGMRNGTYYNYGYACGFVYLNEGKINNCLVMGSIVAYDSYAFYNTNSGQITSCYMLEDMQMSSNRVSGGVFKNKDIPEINASLVYTNTVDIFNKYVDDNDLILNPNNVWKFDGNNYPTLYWEKN